MEHEKAQAAECSCGCRGKTGDAEPSAEQVSRQPTEEKTRQEEQGVTHDQAALWVSRLVARLPREECRACDCFQGFLTQLEIDAAEDLDDVLAPYRVQRDEMHGCLGCDPCPPGEAFTAYLKKSR